ncbi:DUF6325 family protein [Phytomonospora endophytica]|uniref:DUF1269 domain-containing protein n=1 Tax=Phytomonospora endophytica TaxID=714109 RepID=A0A841FVN2_9ACTN|nr:DUF6325 family protein [Phytomonospora endophytica]MBB6037592.1 hypothetical protein [Phytomonospora endophytica]
MSRAEVDFVVVEFPGNVISGKVAEQLRELAARDIIRVIDLVFVTKAEDGTVTSAELPQLDGEEFTSFDPVAQSLDGLIGEEDIATVGEMIPAGSTACVLLFEHLWATWLRDAIDAAGGRVHHLERIPAEAVEEVAAAVATAS